MKTLSVIGSTGSIGVQTLQVAAERGYRVAGLAAGRNADALEQQILQVKPRVAALFDEQAGRALAEKLKDVTDTEICWGEEGVCRVASLEESHGSQCRRRHLRSEAYRCRHYGRQDAGSG